MNLEIETNQDISLAELLQKKQEGFSVMRSAHVGNARIYNQVLADAGIDMLLVDHNITGKDKNYVPGAIIEDGDLRSIAPSGLVSMRALVECPFQQGAQQFVDEVHVQSLQQAFPRCEVTTATEYLRRNESVTGEVIELFAREMPELFTRSLQKEGARVQGDTQGAEVSSRNIVQLQDDPRRDAGILVPNDVDIIVNFAIEALESGRATQYHISGPDMVYYTAEAANRERLQRMYAMLGKTSFGSKLPDDITVVMPKGTDLWLAAPLTDAESVRTLVDSLEAYEQFSAEDKQTRAVFFRSIDSRDEKRKTAFLARQNELRQQYDSARKEAVEGIQDLFVGEREAPFVSQYDTLRAGGLFVPEITQQLTLAELAKLRKMLRKLQGTSP